MSFIEDNFDFVKAWDSFFYPELGEQLEDFEPTLGNITLEKAKEFLEEIPYRLVPEECFINRDDVVFCFGEEHKNSGETNVCGYYILVWITIDNDGLIKNISLED